MDDQSTTPVEPEVKPPTPTVVVPPSTSEVPPATNPNPKPGLKRVLLVIIGLVVLAGLAIGGYYWHQTVVKNNKTKAAKAAQAAIAAQTIKSRALQKSAQVAAGVSALPSSSGTSTTVAGGASNGYFKIPELGIEFVLPSSISDLVYTVTPNSSYKTVSLSTKSLTAQAAACGDTGSNPGLGTLNRGSGQLTTTDQKSSAVTKQLSGFYILEKYPAAECSQTSSVIRTKYLQLSQLQQALSTLQPIQ